MVESLDPAERPAVAADPNLMVLDRGLGCNVTQLGMNDFDTVNGTPTCSPTRACALAIAAAVNKPAYISGFYAGEATRRRQLAPCRGPVLQA